MYFATITAISPAGHITVKQFIRSQVLRHASFYSRKGSLGLRNKAEYSTKAEVRKVELLAVSNEYKAIFWPTSDVRAGIFDSSGFFTDGTCILPQLWYLRQVVKFHPFLWIRQHIKIWKMVPSLYQMDHFQWHQHSMPSLSKFLRMTPNRTWTLPMELVRRSFRWLVP